MLNATPPAGLSISHAQAQAQPQPQHSPSAQAQVEPQTQTSAAQDFNSEQLDALLAPIALYPDALLAQVLMASTFPLEVVSAGRWVDEPGQ